MSSKPDSSSVPFMEATKPMMEWWSQPWMQGVNPMARIQLAWMQSLSDVMQQEANFLMAMAEAGHQLAECHGNHAGDPEKINACYQSIASTIADQHLERMKRVSELPNDFRRRIWEEI